MNKHFFSLNNKNTNFFVYKPFEVDEPDCILVVSHGLAEHSERYNKLCKFMHKHNILTYVISHLGHGKHCNSLGVWPKDGFQVAINNTDILIEKIKKDYPSKSIVLLGHSMGSFLSIGYIEQFGSKLSLCILSGTTDAQPKALSAIGSLIAKSICKVSGRNKPSKILDTLSFGSYNKHFKPTKTSFDWLSKDKDEVLKYVNDPLCGFISSAGLFNDLLDGLNYIYLPEHIDKIPKHLPIYLFGGNYDPVSDFSKGLTALEKRFKKANISNLSIKKYIDNRHECYNETNSTEVMTDTLNKIRSCVLVYDS